MAGEIFYLVLNISILGSVVGAIILLLRRIPVLPRFGIYLLWALPLLRFWMPIGPANKYSLLSLISRYATKTVVVWESGPGAPDLTMTNSLQAATGYFPIEYKTDLLKDIFNIAGLVWAVVTIGAILCSISLYIVTKSAVITRTTDNRNKAPGICVNMRGAETAHTGGTKGFRKQSRLAQRPARFPAGSRRGNKEVEHIKENIYRSDKVLSPVVYGIIRPKIILPMDIAGADMEYILKHEQIHVRRRDNLWRVVAVITACVHWFNPLAWVFVRCFFTDMELACDAMVLKKLGDDDKKSYASALLTCSAGKTWYASAFGGGKTRLRIESVLSYKKLTFASGLCFAALFIAIAVTIITNAAGG